MKRSVYVLLIVGCLGALSAGSVLAESGAYKFGFGGGMAMAFFPDTTGIDRFLSENGLAPMGSFLLGGGGGGREGVIGGLSLGGVGWGMVAATEDEDVSAELVFAGGGLDVGAAVGGDEGSVLTIGTVLGCGASVLTLHGYLVETVTPEGLVPEPIDRELSLVAGFVQPYLSMSAQLLPWMGFEIRFGYVLPLFGFEFGDFLGVPAPSLELSGPTISIGLAFGGIRIQSEPEAEVEADAPRGRAQVTSVSEGSLAVAAGDELVVENALGDILIMSLPADAPGEAGDLTVEWQATRTCRERRIDELQVAATGTETGAALTTTGVGRVDYVLRIPAGIDLKVRNGAGSVTVVGYEGTTIIVENGAGDVELQEVRAAALIIAAGAGKVMLSDIDVQRLIAELGVGEIELALPIGISATVTARARLGDVSVDRFPDMAGGMRGFLGKSADITLGAGERTVELRVGLGEIGVVMQAP